MGCGGEPKVTPQAGREPEHRAGAATEDAVGGRGELSAVLTGRVPLPIREKGSEPRAGLQATTGRLSGERPGPPHSTPPPPPRQSLLPGQGSPRHPALATSLWSHDDLVPSCFPSAPRWGRPWFCPQPLAPRRLSGEGRGIQGAEPPEGRLRTRRRSVGRERLCCVSGHVLGGWWGGRQEENRAL